MHVKRKKTMKNVMRNNWLIYLTKKKKRERIQVIGSNDSLRTVRYHFEKIRKENVIFSDNLNRLFIPVVENGMKIGAIALKRVIL